MDSGRGSVFARLCVAVLLFNGAAFSAVAVDQPTGNSAAPQRPNVVVILADDLGYGDPHCQNPERNKLATPNMDALAAAGMRFTDAHSSSGVCSPSRYALLTGRYHWRTRLQRGIVGVWQKPLIAENRLTLAGLLRSQGYQTACVGKWHLGWDWNIPEGAEPFFLGLAKAGNAANLQTPDSVTDEHRARWSEVLSRPIAGGPTTRGFNHYFGTDVPNWPPYAFIADDRVQGAPSTLLPPALLKNHLASLQGPALPDWKLENILPALVGESRRFIASCSSSKQPFFLYLPFTTPHTPLAVNDAWRGKSGLGNAAADLILETDAAVGQVLAALADAGVTDNTLVIFTSDNGFAPYVGAKDLESKGHFPSGPLRDYKASAYEGGHRVPFFVRWPGVVRPGTVSAQLTHHADILPTVAEALGVKLPEDAAEDGFSLLPILRGGTASQREWAISCGSDGTPSVRQGSWKLILKPEIELYYLSVDLGETKNVASEQSERVQRMREHFESLIVAGRSNPGPKQRNDIRVERYPKEKAAEAKKKANAS